MLTGADATMPGGPALAVVETRVYYDPDTGDVVHLHSLMAHPSDRLGERRIREEMATFEESLAVRHDRPLASLKLTAEEASRVLLPGVRLRIDVRDGTLIADHVPGRGMSTGAGVV